MYKRYIWLVILLMAMCWGNSAEAVVPTLNGSSGLLSVPAADVPAAGVASVAWYQGADAGAAIVYAPVHGVELGVLRILGSQADSTAEVSVKLQLRQETLFTPGIAIGADHLAGSGVRGVYTVASKALPYGLRLHAGIGTGLHAGVFAGIEKIIKPAGFIGRADVFPALSVMAEYDDKQLVYGGRLALRPGVKLAVGWRGSSFFWGISFTR